MSPKTRSADTIARDYTEEALGTIAEVMIDPYAEHKDRLRASEMLLDRGHGKAVSAVISVPAGKRVQAQLATMTDEELLAAIREQPLPRLLGPRLYSCGPECPGDHESNREICAVVEPAVDPLLL